MKVKNLAGGEFRGTKHEFLIGVCNLLQAILSAVARPMPATLRFRCV